MEQQYTKLWCVVHKEYGRSRNGSTGAAFYTRKGDALKRLKTYQKRGYPGYYVQGFDLVPNGDDYEETPSLN